MVDPRDIFRRFSAQAKRVLTASQEAAESSLASISSEHILIALAVTPDTLASELLKEYAVTLEQIRLVLSLNNLWNRETGGLSDDARTVLTAALRMAARYHHEEIEPEHLLLAITSTRDSRAYQVIARVGVDPNHLRRQLETMLGEAADLQLVISPDLGGGNDDVDVLDSDALEEHDRLHHPGEHTHAHNDEGDEPHTHPTQANPKKGKVLELFTTDMTAQAKAGLLDPVIGRSEEIQRTIQILARRSKNNPVLLGEPGVGKTAIVEGLAQRIVTGTVPPILHGKRLVRLDLGLLVAGTMYRGQFEDRLKKVLAEVAADKRIILFIDEIHTMVGTGSAEGSMDASNMLKPALARGEIRLIGATTLDDYRKFIEKDAALERRFQTVFVGEPSADETLLILEGLRKAHEDHHHVVITQEAMQVAVDLSRRYMTDRFLPDKAIDLIDEAAAAKQISHPNHISRNVIRITGRIEQLIKQKERAIEREAFAQAATLRAKETKYREKLAKLETDDQRANHPLVSAADIAAVVSTSTGVPLNHLIREEREATNLETTLASRVLGQKEAVHTIAAAIRRAEAGINKGSRPLGSFLLLGPSGVGKTELARVLAEQVFGTKDAFIKLDMSEFMERHTVARLVGAPAGYVGYEDAGKLTELVRRRPYALLLLDEIEKAHPDVQNILLQIMEDGVLSDAKGRKISFANTIIMLTSNLGSQMLSGAQALGFQAKTRKEQEAADEQYIDLSKRVTNSAKEFFSPEFINRLDAMIVFRALNQATITEIADLRINELIEQLAHDGYALTVTAPARSLVAKYGFDQEYGARPIRRLITNWIEDPLADLILSKQLVPGKTVRVVPDGETVKLTLGK